MQLNLYCPQRVLYSEDPLHMYRSKENEKCMYGQRNTIYYYTFTVEPLLAGPWNEVLSFIERCP